MSNPEADVISLNVDRLGPDESIQIIGNPQWREAAMASIASREGNAAALDAAYRSAGKNCTEEIFGDFAFIVNDQKQNIALAATDRMGRWPVYYRSDGEVIHISSRLEELLHQLNPQICEQGIYNYVYFHMVPAPGSIYGNIHKLRAGESLLWEDGKLTLSRYWVPEFVRGDGHNRSSLEQQLKLRLGQAVEKCILPGKVTGCFLSGGLDSSTVAGMLAKAGDVSAEAFAIGFDAEGYDEIPYARITAKHFGIKLNEYYVTPEDIVERLPEIATHYGEPFGNSSALPAYFCARFAASHGVEQLLAGDGGDEIFAGNERYYKQQIFEKYALVPSLIRRSMIEPLTALLPDKPLLLAKIKSYIQQARVPMPDRTQSYNFLHRHLPEELFQRDFLQEVSSSQPIESLREVYNKPAIATQLDRMLYMDWQFTLADNDLRKVNQMCELAGVSVGFPMLDDDLVAFSMQIPDKIKIEKGNLRSFYKEALRGWLPDATIAKEKKGFGLPFGVWLQEHKPLKELALDNLLGLKERPYFNPEFIDRTIDLHKTGHTAYYGELIWILVVLELWLKGVE